MSYKIEPLDREEHCTLHWLSERGYDHGIYQKLAGNEIADGGYEFDSIPEHVAWEFMDALDDEAFLTCNGSRSLARKLLAFLESIV